MNDLDLIHRALKNPNDYGLIVERYEQQLLRFIKSLSQLSSADAEDLAQQVFLKAYDHLNDFDQKLKLSTWLFRIARNQVIDFWRRKKVRPQEYSLDEARDNGKEASVDNFSDELDKKFTSQRVQKLLKLLQPEYREVLYLYYYEDRNYDEIADIIQRPPGTVAALISRAKKAFSDLAIRTHEITYLKPSA
jgi:RNA polymerase sigma-70 factor (ECF subfamily)